MQSSVLGMRGVEHGGQWICILWEHPVWLRIKVLPQDTRGDVHNPGDCERRPGSEREHICNDGSGRAPWRCWAEGMGRMAFLVRGPAHKGMKVGRAEC